MNKLQKVNIAFLPIFLSFSIIFLSIGYAAISSITGEIKGTVIANKQDGIFITDVVYDSSLNANPSLSTINSYYQTTLNSSILLSSNNDAGNSSITYEVTIYNSTDDLYQFNKVLYGDEFYDNENITFKLTNLKKGDKLAGKSSITFYITFSYVDDIVAANNILNSYLNFDFIRAGDLIIDYTITKAWDYDGIHYYQAEFILTNIGVDIVSNWNVEIYFPTDVIFNSSWGDGCEPLFSSNESIINVAGVEKLAIGASLKFFVQFGVPIADFQEFEDIVIDSQVVDDSNANQDEPIVSTPGLEFNVIESTNWPSGNGDYAYLYNLEVKNVSDQPISDWQLVIEIPYSGYVSSSWNVIYENADLYIIIKPLEGSSPIQPGDSYNQGGFIIEGAHANFKPVIR